MEKKNKSRTCLQLFISTLYLSAFTFGGGYVIVTLLKQKYVDQLHWITEDEMLDLVAIAQSSPGAVAVNGAIVVGYQLGGIPGVLISVLGAILPPFVILSVVSLFYAAFRENTVVQAVLKGMRAGVCAVIFSTVLDMILGIIRSGDLVSVLSMAAAFIACCFLRINVIWLITAAAVLGAVRTVFRKRRQKP